jgi:hypothetical protein
MCYLDTVDRHASLFLCDLFVLHVLPCHRLSLNLFLSCSDLVSHRMPTWPTVRQDRYQLHGLSTLSTTVERRKIVSLPDSLDARTRSHVFSRCVGICPEGTYAAAGEKLCLPCHPQCGSCRNASASSCVSCKPGLLLIHDAMKCAESCPEQYYTGKSSTRCRQNDRNRPVFLRYSST